MKNRDRSDFLRSHSGLCTFLQHEKSDLSLFLSLFIVCALCPVPFLQAQDLDEGILPEVVIKAKEEHRMKSTKPPLDIVVDSFETIRESLEPDQSVLLSQPPKIITWKRNHPEFLHVQRVIQPWRTAFSRHFGVAFCLKDRFSSIFQKRLSKKEVKKYGWSLTVVDETGRPFREYKGDGSMPDKIFWDGKDENDKWIKAGLSYSAIFKFFDPSGSAYTSIGSPIQFGSVAYQRDRGFYINLDSLILFGPNKSGKTIEKPDGVDLMRAMADFVKRRYFNVPIAITVFAQNRELAQAQANSVQNHLLAELMYSPRAIVARGRTAFYSEQKTDILLLNR